MTNETPTQLCPYCAGRNVDCMSCYGTGFDLETEDGMRGWLWWRVMSRPQQLAEISVAHTAIAAEAWDFYKRTMST